MPPASIRKFELFYLAAWGIGLIIAFLGWNGEAILQTRLGAQIGLGTYAAILCAGLLIPPVLWWLAARRRSNVARWIIVALFALQGLNIVFSLFAASLAGVLGGLSLLMFCLRAVAVRFLFGPEAREWFAKSKAAPLPSTEPLPPS